MALGQGPLDGLLVAWKGVVSEQKHFFKPNRTLWRVFRGYFSGKRACGSFAHISRK
jgi:hypothetical protein